MSRPHRAFGSGVAILLVLALAVPLTNQPVGAAVPPGFQEQIVFSGLVRPTNLEFAADGRIFVAEQRGTIKVFDDLADPTATVFADLQPVVHNQWDRGLLGMALHPQFPAQPWIYVLYTYDAPPGQAAPFWNDDCNGVSGGANGGRCVVTARLSRLPAGGGAEQVLIHDWCQQFPSHSIGNLRFGADGALYVSAGDGASFSTVDYGQLPTGGPINPCGDPPGGSMQPPGAQGGALRSQALRSTQSNPLKLDGAILRLDPATGAAMPDNPLASSPDPNRARVVAHGIRNPYRITVRPGTSEVWIADVGWNTWEEINVLPDPTAAPRNFGWPCYEGAAVMSSYANANLNLCSTLYSGSGQTAPHYTYRHADRVVAGETCPTGSSAVTGLAFYPAAGGPYPARFHGALFFADHSRQCIWAMKPVTPGGLPSPASIETFVAPASTPVDLEVGPGGELYWADIAGGTIRRVRYTPGNTPPTAVIDASPSSGALPLAVQFDGTGTFDPDPADQESLDYEWDFTDDGTVDATTPTAQFTYTTAGSYTARLTVSDTLGGSDTTTVTITAGSQAPIAVMDTPAPGLTWAVGDEIGFSGHATEADGTPLPAGALSWQLRIQHCSAPDNCHTHVGQSWTGVASGSFIAPDHEYPSHLELVLTAENADGLTHTVVRELHPKTVDLTVASSPPGLQLSLGAVTAAAPFTVTVIQGSANTISAPSPQTQSQATYAFQQWSQGGPQTQVLTAPAVPTTYTASFAATQLPNLALGRPATASGQCRSDEGPAKAVNGSWTGGLRDKWCALGATSWWRVDLGSTMNIGTVVIRHAGAGGENTQWNTRNFNLQVSNNGTSWTTVATISNNTQSVTTHPLAASGRYLRLNVSTPTSNGNQATRIYEVEVYPPG
jgi:glucose/arabinose dehydrogenase